VNRAYIDTTVLTDALLKGNPRTKAALAPFDWSGLPVYAINEFRAGPLRNWIWFYNKLVSNSYSDALRALHRMGFTPKRYTTLTAIEALQQVAREFESMVNEEVLAKYPGDTLGHVIRDQYLLHLKRRIVQSWRQRRSLTTDVVQELPCYTERVPRFQPEGIIEKDHLGCDHGGECSLAVELRKRRLDLEKILADVSKTTSETGESATDQDTEGVSQEKNSLRTRGQTVSRARRCDVRNFLSK
jgi:hypothetical protein